MKRYVPLFFFVGLFLLAAMLPAPAFAQTVTLTPTTLSQAQASTDKYACLASTTGIVLPSTSANGSTLLVGKEPERVTSATEFSTSCYYVTRAQRPVAHVSGELVYLGPKNQFYSADPATGHGGACTLTSLSVHPYINLSTGDVFRCINSIWQRVNGYNEGQTARATAQFDAVTGTTGATLTNVTGMSVTVSPGNYRFVVNLPGVATANSGIKAGFKYTGTTLTSIESTARIFTASAVAVQHSTTATDQATLAGSTTAAIFTVIEGTMVVSVGGTIQLQAAQNAAHADTTSVYAGASMTFTRIN